MSTVIITGASKGIGKATAIRFVANGDNVINISRTPSDVDGVENVAIDLADPDAPSSVGQLVDKLASGDIHLIHNAAKLVNDSVSCLLYTSPSPRDAHESRMPSSA